MSTNTTLPESEVLDATITLLKKSIGITTDSIYVNKEGTHLMREVGDYHSDWDEKSRPLTDEEKSVLVHIKFLTEKRDEAALKECEMEVLNLESRLRFKREDLERKRQVMAQKA